MNNQEGSVLIISLAISAVILILLGIFLGSIVAEKRRQMRSFCSNQAFNLAEAGIEYGIWALNNEDITTWDKDETGNSVSSFTVNTSGEKIGCSTVAITSTTASATITSTGSVSYDSANIDRKVTINAENLGAFIFDSAITATSEVTVTGNAIVEGAITTVSVELPEVVIPSFDSTDTLDETESPITSGGTYEYGNMNLTTGETLQIAATGASVVIYIKGDATINGEIQIASGCSVSLYVGGKTSIAGQAKINENGDPSKFVLYGAGPCQFTANNVVFYGVVYAPEVEVKVTGGLICGCLIGGTVDVAGNCTIRYNSRVADLADSPLFKNFKFKPHSWQEIPS